jgi:hypothetical protein
MNNKYLYFCASVLAITCCETALAGKGAKKIFFDEKTVFSNISKKLLKNENKYKNKNLFIRFYSNKSPEYKIHPAIGIARVGNDSEDNFYVAPSEIGGLPKEKISLSFQEEVKKFKNNKGEIRKQAAYFRIYKDGTPISTSDNEIESINWTVHLANKKAAWWDFNEFCGNLMISNQQDQTQPNSYEYWSTQVEKDSEGKPVLDPEGREIPIMKKRNKEKKENRKSLIIDPGYRTVSLKTKEANFDATSAPSGYKVSFPGELDPYSIKTLGKLRMNEDGSLFVLGGYGYSGGQGGKITGFGGGDGWFDDVSDGPVEAYIRFKDGTTKVLKAWAVVGSPKYAPELVNITTWDDTILDMAVRNFNKYPEIFDINTKTFNLGEKGYWPSFEEDILPIFNRMRNYEWVSNVGPMVFFSYPHFNIRDRKIENRQNRRDWFNYLRETVDLKKETTEDFVLSKSHNNLYKNGYPLMPLNSGDNSVRNQSVSKFITLSPLQYYMLYQWSEGFFNSEEHDKGSEFLQSLKLNHLDRASVGNCVGYPMSPGIEVTWSIRNPRIYEENDFYRIKHIKSIEEYKDTGLDPNRDETEESSIGCEPGDLTKRMAIPWTADFLNCSVQNINFTIPNRNKESGKPIPPTYYAYWWPAQAPWDVYTSNKEAEEQNKDGNPSGLKVNYQRGINSYMDMVKHWSKLGFVLNQNEDERLKKNYPHFAEKERNLDSFNYKQLALSDQANIYVDGFSEQQDDVIAQNLYYTKDKDNKKK